MAYGTVNADVIGTSTTNSNLGAGNATLFKNRVINGAMTISQRNGTTATSQTNGAYNLDRWYGYSYNAGATTGKYTVTQSTSAPAGFSNSLLVTSSSALAISSGDIYGINQNIEGVNIADLNWGSANGKACVLSFWVQCSLTGVFGGALRNQNGTHGFPFTYTISSANTWQQVTVAIPAPPVGSTWQTDNSSGIYIFNNLQIGSTYTNSATGAWQTIANSGYGATGCVNILNTNGATFYITGVQFEVGPSATGFEFRPYTTELQLCQRYYEQMIIGNGGTTATPLNMLLSGVLTGSNCTHIAYFKVTKRSNPSWAAIGGATWQNTPNNSTTSVDFATFQNTTSGYFYLGTAVGQGIGFSSEL